MRKIFISFFLIWFIFLIENSTAAENYMHYVKGSRIFDGKTNKEVIWRGAGGSYLFHTDDYMTAWQLHLPEIQKMGLNTVRLAFRFPDSNPGENGFIDADTLNYTRLDEVLNFLDQHNIKAILDLHNYLDMYGDFGSQKIIDDWKELTARYKGDSRIIAYELFNEPYGPTRNISIKTGEDVAKFYANLTKEIRKIDPDHIVIWQGDPSYYFHRTLDEFKNYLQPNVVYTSHKWWTTKENEFEIYTPEQISYKSMNYLVKKRDELDVPFWLGEFGGKGGGNARYNSSSPHWQISEQLLYRSEEQAIGWNLWQGRTEVDKPWYSEAMFPLKFYNQNLIRKYWYNPVPNLTSYIEYKQGVDWFNSYEPWEIRMWHNKDFVTFKPGITVRVIINTVLPNGSVEIISDETIEINETTNITNYEGGELGDRNTYIYSLAEKDLVGYWDFDEGKGKVIGDRSIYSNNGTLYGGLEPQWTTGRFFNGLDFDGLNDYVLVKDTYSLDLKDKITIEAWIYPKSWSSPYPRVISKEVNTSANPYALELDMYNKSALFCLDIGIGESCINSGTNSISLNQWLYVVGTWDGTDIQIYINGELRNTKKLIGTMSDTSNNVLIGNNPSNNRQFNGTIDEVKIWNRALTEAEIKQEYGKHYTISGQLKDMYSNVIQADIKLYQKDTNYIISSVETDAQGNYLLNSPDGVQDIEYKLLNFPISNYWIKLVSIYTFTDLSNLVDLITKTDNNISFKVNLTDNQLIQVYSPNKPKTIKANNLELKEVFSPFEITLNSWFYNSSENRIEMMIDDF